LEPYNSTNFRQTFEWPPPSAPRFGRIGAVGAADLNVGSDLTLQAFEKHSYQQKPWMLGADHRLYFNYDECVVNNKGVVSLSGDKKQCARFFFSKAKYFILEAESGPRQALTVKNLKAGSKLHVAPLAYTKEQEFYMPKNRRDPERFKAKLLKRHKNGKLAANSALLTQLLGGDPQDDIISSGFHDEL